MAAFLFQRNWASFAFPRYLRALDLIQKEVFGDLGMRYGDYSLYGVKVESLFLPPELPALEEYGLPVQLGLKLQRAASRWPSSSLRSLRLWGIAARR